MERPPNRQQIAQRIHDGLLRELGQGIDLRQMLHSALYARDVLLVCSAYPGTELPQLGRLYEQACRVAEADRPPDTVPSQHGGLESRVAAATSHPVDGRPEADSPPSRPGRRWFVPSTWFGTEPG